MKKWYFSAALLTAGWLGQAATAPAQSSHLLTPYGAARLPEPLPCGQAAPGPDLVPGPIDPAATPPVPVAGTEYPADHPSAFQCEEFPSDDHWYVHSGAVGLLRQKLGNQPIAAIDPVNLKNGIVSGSGVTTIQNLTDVGQDWNFGPKLTVGYLWQNQGIEVTGFWIPLYHNSTYTEAPGQLDLPFFNPPIGFEGDNGLWTHADNVVTTFRSSMAGGEINYRYTDAAITDAELILGVRYLSLYEALGIFTGDDDFTFRDVNGRPDPVRQATYQTQTHNNIVAPQIGFEWGHTASQYFTLGITGKAALGVDFVDEHNTLTRGDGFKGFDFKRHLTVPASQIYEAGAFLDFNILERMRLRVGYNAMFLVNVAPASDQVDFNLANPSGRNEVHSTIFYHGPMAELQILF